MSSHNCLVIFNDLALIFVFILFRTFIQRAVECETVHYVRFQVPILLRNCLLFLRRKIQRAHRAHTGTHARAQTSQRERGPLETRTGRP